MGNKRLQGALCVIIIIIIIIIYSPSRFMYMFSVRYACNLQILLSSVLYLFVTKIDIMYEKRNETMRPIWGCPPWWLSLTFMISLNNKVTMLL